MSKQPKNLKEKKKEEKKLRTFESLPQNYMNIFVEALEVATSANPRKYAEVYTQIRAQVDQEMKARSEK